MGIWGRWAARREHTFAQKNLSGFLDDELSERRSSRVRAHLSECESCRLALASLRTTVRALAQLPRATLPRSFRLSPQAVASQQRLRVLDTRFATLRTAGVALSLALAILLAGDQLLARGVIYPPTVAVVDQGGQIAMMAAEAVAPEQVEEAQPEAFALLEAEATATPEQPIAEAAEPAAEIETPPAEKAPVEAAPAPAAPEQTPPPDQEVVARLAAPAVEDAAATDAALLPSEPVAAARAAVQQALGALSVLALAVGGGLFWVARKRRL